MTMVSTRASAVSSCSTAMMRSPLVLTGRPPFEQAMTSQIVAGVQRRAEDPRWDAELERNHRSAYFAALTTVV